MPIPKSALQRYRIIDEMIGKKPFRYPSPEKLLEACKDYVKSKSTIEKDLYTLKYELDAPIEYDKKHKGYYYSHPNFKLLGIILTREELRAMDFVEKILQRMESIPFINEYSNAVDKLQNGLNRVKEIKETIIQENFIDIDRSYKGEGSKYLPLIIEAITNKKKINFTYQKFDSSKIRTYVLSPMKLKEVNTQWYLIGYDETAMHEKTFGLNRIIDLEIIDEHIYIPEQIIAKVELLFEHIYGITNEESSVEEIILSFTPLRGKYVELQPIHKSQKEIQNDDKAYVIGLRLIPNRELMTLLLSFGRDMEILQPESLRLRFKNLLEETLAKYSNVP